jgi:hypothetical protein
MQAQHQRTVPQEFRILAFVTTHNDEDLIIPVLSSLLKQGVDVHVIDNWSSDQTWRKLQEFQSENPGAVRAERYPEAASREIVREQLLKRMEQLASEIAANWFVLVEARETPLSPWQACSLREAIFRVDQEGFNAVDFTVVDLFPMSRENSPDQANPEDFLQFFSSFHDPVHFVQITAWRNQSQKVDLASSGGHEARFGGRRMYPYKFLLRRYPTPSQPHGEPETTVNQSIRSGLDNTEKEWYFHDLLAPPEFQALQSSRTLEKFDDDFYSDFLVERISGIGINAGLP